MWKTKDWKREETKPLNGHEVGAHRFMKGQKVCLCPVADLQEAVLLPTQNYLFSTSC